MPLSVTRDRGDNPIFVMLDSLQHLLIVWSWNKFRMTGKMSEQDSLTRGCTHYLASLEMREALDRFTETSSVQALHRGVGSNRDFSILLHFSFFIYTSLILSCISILWDSLSEYSLSWYLRLKFSIYSLPISHSPTPRKIRIASMRQ